MFSTEDFISVSKSEGIIFLIKINDAKKKKEFYVEVKLLEVVQIQEERKISNGKKKKHYQHKENTI